MKQWLNNAFKQAAWAPLLIFVVYAIVAKAFSAYLIWPWLDMPTHFLGGMAITYFYIVAVKHAQQVVALIPRAIRMALALGLTAISAIVWEFLEFASDKWLGTQMNLGVADTLSDLFFGLLGGALMLLISMRASSTRKFRH
jgi:hypothetical protein